MSGLPSNKGGNMSLTKTPTRTQTVQLNEGLATYEPRPGYQANIDTLLSCLHNMPDDAKVIQGVQNPLLKLHSFTSQTKTVESIARAVYIRRKKPIQAFRQLMCYMGMKSKIEGDVQTFTFSREMWNKNGFRLISNGDSKGKPRLLFKWDNKDKEMDEREAEAVAGLLELRPMVERDAEAVSGLLVLKASSMDIFDI